VLEPTISTALEAQRSRSPLQSTASKTGNNIYCQDTIFSVVVYYMLFFIFQKLIGIILLLMYTPIDTTVVTDSILRMMDLRAAIRVRTSEAKNISLALSTNVIIIALP
jgi:hypothetical protein